MACCPTEAKYGYDDSRFEKAVDDDFHCSICYNVLKEPMMCRNNEHLFCRDCITKHLNTNSHTCPECNEDLTVETLRRARLASNILSRLKIKCDYSHRGCQEFIRLEELDSHVENCGFVPVKCSNEKCEMIVNKREIIHHESTVCEYRRVKCHNCVNIEQDVKEMKEKMEGLDENIEGIETRMEEMDGKIVRMDEKIEAVETKMEGMAAKIEGMETEMRKKLDGVNKKIEGMATDVDKVKGMMIQMFEKLRFLENSIQISSAINHALNSSIDDIFVAGGRDGDGEYLKSVERFLWKKNVWERLYSMNVARKGATSFVYDNQVFVTGGCDSNAVEALNLDEDQHLWVKTQAMMPYHCKSSRSVVYQNRAVIFCACYRTDSLTELCLDPPYTCKQLCKMPEPPRAFYGMTAFDHKVLIFGGKHTGDDHVLDSVLEYDLSTNEFKVMPPLPYAVYSMAVVRWGDQAVLAGGFCDDAKSKKVFMYDSKTGYTTELPSMLEERTAPAAVITGNTIVVMGGKGQAGRVRSVEAFTLGGYSWRYLPAMNDIRSLATATVLPTKSIH